jgi:3-dehydroquinate dehydratase II
MKIIVINGPNLNLLGKREPDIYGAESLDDMMARVKQRGKEIKVDVESVQSNEEGTLVTKIGETSGKYDGIIINPAAYTHTSVALRDAILACKVPCVEVHLSNIYSREEFRHKSLTAAACIGQISGFGATSYLLALDGLVSHLKSAKKNK